MWILYRMSNKYVTLGQLIKKYMLPMGTAPFCKALKEVKTGKLRQKGELYSNCVAVQVSGPHIYVCASS